MTVIIDTKLCKNDCFSFTNEIHHARNVPTQVTSNPTKQFYIAPIATNDPTDVVVQIEIESGVDDPYDGDRCWIGIPTRKGAVAALL